MSTGEKSEFGPDVVYQSSRHGCSVVNSTQHRRHPAKATVPTNDARSLLIWLGYMPLRDPDSSIVNITIPRKASIVGIRRQMERSELRQLTMQLNQAAQAFNSPS
ncbi:MAG: hypothetical protein ALECFALPRED_008844 [Alectoria fallacina]|uniref:Uncharacterized protein n=1 Tax=Alectoria fallacina TaxID=1903189 RepID=A0A8H3PHE3_9LECA|nr:MAG: hypothetical protein ALECFALPRED_008844 [Alectoria fallacina]